MHPMQLRLRTKTHSADTAGYEIQPMQVAQLLYSTYLIWQTSRQLPFWRASYFPQRPRQSHNIVCRITNTAPATVVATLPGRMRTSEKSACPDVLLLLASRVSLCIDRCLMGSQVRCITDQHPASTVQLQQCWQARKKIERKNTLASVPE